uniref:Uncharacterized protein n=1 Tax=Anguilla anguilla TaxID=7936 RepID=A0A0E9T6C3_ANGAN
MWCKVLKLQGLCFAQRCRGERNVTVTTQDVCSAAKMLWSSLALELHSAVPVES